MEEFFSLKVINVVAETADACTIELQVPSDMAGSFTYEAGQYLTFEIPWNDFKIRRCYSLCSAPEAEKTLSIAVKRVEGGRGSNWFNDTVKPGMAISTSRPAGRFVLRRENTCPIIFAAGGSGITPVISLIKSALLNSERKIRLIYANQNRQSVIFDRALEDLSKQYSDRFAYVCHLDSDNQYLDGEKITWFVGDNWQSDFYVCGPDPFMNLVEETLKSNNVPRSNIFIERFSSPVDPDYKDTGIPPGDSEHDAAISNVKFIITFNGIDTEIPYQTGGTLLDSVLAHPDLKGVPHSCREGHCGSCMSILKTGKVRMTANRVLSRRDIAAGYVLPCQSIPLTEISRID